MYYKASHRLFFHDPSVKSLVLSPVIWQVLNILCDFCDRIKMTCYCGFAPELLQIPNTPFELLPLMHYHKTNVVKSYDTNAVISHEVWHQSAGSTIDCPIGTQLALVALNITHKFTWASAGWSFTQQLPRWVWHGTKPALRSQSKALCCPQCSKAPICLDFSDCKDYLYSCHTWNLILCGHFMNHSCANKVR